MHMESILIAEATIQKQIYESHLLWHHSH